jgi:hypothetical protein
MWFGWAEVKERILSTAGSPQVEARGSNGADLADWRGETFSHMRQLIKAADPNIVEEWKWMGTPVWSHDGIVCTGESYKSIVKLTFAKGASLPDPGRVPAHGVSPQPGES